MTCSEIQARIVKRIDDDPVTPGSCTPAEAQAAINEGQELASWLTLCLETTVPLTLPANTTFLSLRATLPDYLAPLRLTIAGTRIRPATLAQMDAENDQWQATPGTPTRYLALGFAFFGVNQQPVSDTVSQFTYARAPLVMVSDAFPEIPEAYHQSLVDYGIYKVKLKEGAQGLQRGQENLKRFLDDMTKLADFVRAKSRASRYDTAPFEMQLFDRSRLTQ